MIWDNLHYKTVCETTLSQMTDRMSKYTRHYVHWTGYINSAVITSKCLH